MTSQWNWGSLNSAKYQVKDNATITQNRKRVQKNDNSQQKNKNKKKTVCPATILSSVDELIGKVIDHYCFLKDEDELWNKGVV